MAEIDNGSVVICQKNSEMITLLSGDVCLNIWLVPPRFHLSAVSLCLLLSIGHLKKKEKKIRQIIHH